MSVANKSVFSPCPLNNPLPSDAEFSRFYSRPYSLALSFQIAGFENCSRMSWQIKILDAISPVETLKRGISFFHILRLILFWFRLHWIYWCGSSMTCEYALLHFTAPLVSNFHPYLTWRSRKKPNILNFNFLTYWNYGWWKFIFASSAPFFDISNYIIDFLRIRLEFSNSISL